MKKIIMCAAVVMAIAAVPTTAGPTVVNLSSATSISFQGWSRRNYIFAKFLFS